MDTKTEELQLAPPQPGEPAMKQLAPYEGYREKIEKLKSTAETLTVTDIADRAGMALARTTRLALKEVRVAVTHRHKELKEGILVEGRKIDAGKNELLALIEPLEARLEEQEKFVEREVARIQAEKRTARTAELTPFLAAPIAIDLGTMTDEAYASMLTDVKEAQAARIAREKKERDEAEAKAKAEAEERERIRLENEQLRKEAAEREESARKEREAAAAVLAKEREESARLAREAKEKADAEAKKLREEAKERERIASEKARKEREEIEATAKAERETREKVESELAAKKAAEEQEAAEKAAAEKAAAMAPEKEKLNKFATDVRILAIPLFASGKGADYVKEVSEAVERFAAWIEKKAASL